MTAKARGQMTWINGEKSKLFEQTSDTAEGAIYNVFHAMSMPLHFAQQKGYLLDYKLWLVVEGDEVEEI